MAQRPEDGPVIQPTVEDIAMARSLPVGKRAIIIARARQAELELADAKDQLDELRKVTEALKIDKLTEMLTRDSFLPFIDECLTEDGRYHLYIGDIMGLKEINETGDNVGGDQAIMLAAKFWKRVAQEGGGVSGRLGGDELAMVIDTNAMPLELIETMLCNRPSEMDEIALRWCDTPLIEGMENSEYLRAADPKAVLNVENKRVRSHVELGKTPVIQGAYYLSRSGERHHLLAIIDDDTGIERSGKSHKTVLMRVNGGNFKVRRIEDFTAERVVKGRAVANFTLIQKSSSKAI
jgi:GGDEF domain-containing protein